MLVSRPEIADRRSSLVARRSNVIPAKAGIQRSSLDPRFRGDDRPLVTSHESRVTGFTLIEVMVAVAILAIISVLTWQTMSSNLKAKERYEARGEYYHAITATLNRMAEDLSSVFLASEPDNLGVAIGGELMTKNVFKGDESSLNFVSFSHVRFMKDSKESDQCEIAYSVKPNEDDGAFYDIMKREASPIDDDEEDGGSTYLMMEKVKKLGFRYYDGEKFEWREEWDSASFDHKDKVPRAVEIAITIPDIDNEEEVVELKTIALIDMAPGPNNF